MDKIPELRKKEEKEELHSLKVRDVADDHKKWDDPTKAQSGSGVTVYMMPESYNELRRILERDFPNLWTGVQYYMAFDAQKFIQYMDEALDTITQFDSGNVDGICKRYIDELRKKQGFKPLHTPSEYYNNAEMEAMVKLARDVHENVPPFEIKKLLKGN